MAGVSSKERSNYRVDQNVNQVHDEQNAKLINYFDSVHLFCRQRFEMNHVHTVEKGDKEQNLHLEVKVLVQKDEHRYHYELANHKDDCVHGAEVAIHIDVLYVHSEFVLEVRLGEMVLIGSNLRITIQRKRNDQDEEQDRQRRAQYVLKSGPELRKFLKVFATKESTHTQGNAQY